MDAFADRLARALGASPEEAADLLRRLSEHVLDGLDADGACTLRGIGTFSRTADGVGFAPDASLATAVNHRYAGLPSLVAPGGAAEAAPPTAATPPPPATPRAPDPEPASFAPRPAPAPAVPPPAPEEVVPPPPVEVDEDDIDALLADVWTPAAEPAASPLGPPPESSFQDADFDVVPPAEAPDEAWSALQGGMTLEGEGEGNDLPEGVAPAFDDEPLPAPDAPPPAPLFDSDEDAELPPFPSFTPAEPADDAPEEGDEEAPVFPFDFGPPAEEEPAEASADEPAPVEASAEALEPPPAPETALEAAPADDVPPAVAATRPPPPAPPHVARTNWRTPVLIVLAFLGAVLLSWWVTRMLADDPAETPAPVATTAPAPVASPADTALAAAEPPADTVATPPPPAPREETPLRGTAAVDPAAGGYTWVVGSESTEADAARTVQRYRRAGYRVAALPAEVNGRTFFRIGLGQFRSLRAAQSARTDLPPDAPSDAWPLALR